MKKIFVLLFTVIGFTAISLKASAQDAKQSEFKFEQETHDFGTIPQGKPVTYDFKFVNTGDEPLIIKSTTASCGCTVPEFPKEPVLPGKTGVIKVTYSAAAPGPFNKTITITSNAKTPTKVLYIKGIVEQASGR